MWSGLSSNKVELSERESTDLDKRKEQFIERFVERFLAARYATHPATFNEGLITAVYSEAYMIAEKIWERAYADRERVGAARVN